MVTKVSPSKLNWYEISAKLPFDAPQFVHLSPRIWDLFEHHIADRESHAIIIALSCKETTAVLMLHPDWDVAQVYEYLFVDSYQTKILGVCDASAEALPTVAIFTMLNSHVYIYEGLSLVRVFPKVLTALAASQDQRVYALICEQKDEWLIRVDLSGKQLTLTYTRLDTMGAHHLVLNHDGKCTAILSRSSLVTLDGGTASVLTCAAFETVFLSCGEIQCLVSSTEQGVFVFRETLWVLAKLKLEYEGAIYCVESYNQPEASVTFRNMRFQSLCPPKLFSLKNGNYFAMYCETERVVLIFELTLIIEDGKEDITPVFLYALYLGQCTLLHLSWSNSDIIMLLKGMKQTELRLSYTNGGIKLAAQSTG